ncbi:MAG: glycosyltransferase 87 family protein [Gaiellaceae bacterium]
MFLAAWVAIQHGFYADERIDDTAVYQAYGDAIVNGELPYRDFRPEYPPAALPVFAVPSLAQADEGLAAYTRAFAWVMAACGVALIFAVAAINRSWPVLGFLALWPLALGSVALARYDLWPAALTAGALAAFLSGRDRLGAGTLALAVAAKIYPVALVPLAAVWVWRRGRLGVCAAIFAAVLFAVFLPFAILGPEGLASSLGRQLSRPLQIESLWAAVLIVLPLDVEMVGSHGSQNIAGRLGDVVGTVATLVQVAVLAAIWIAFARGAATRERLVRYAALTLVALVALGKVLSPQFLIWLIPVVPLAGLAPAALLAAALVLTQTWFPYRYWDYARDFDGTVTGLVLARDLVLLALLGVLASPPGRGWLRRRVPFLRRRTPPAAPRS